MGERNESTNSSGLVALGKDEGAGIRYVRLVVDASKAAPT